MTHIYAFANQKGGVGKTTTAVSLGAYLADAGKRVLLIDSDPQANATSSLGIDPSSVQISLYDALIRRQSLAEVTIATPTPGLDLAPSAPGLAGAEVEMVSMLAREYLLRRALEGITDQYDHVLIDCPPSLGLLTINALTSAADGVIVPIQCEYLALEGLGRLWQTVTMVREHLNPQLFISGMVLTMFDSRDEPGRTGRDRGAHPFPRTDFSHRDSAQCAVERGAQLRPNHPDLRPTIGGRTGIPGVGAGTDWHAKRNWKLEVRSWIVSVQWPVANIQHPVSSF